MPAPLPPAAAGALAAGGAAPVPVIMAAAKKAGLHPTVPLLISAIHVKWSKHNERVDVRRIDGALDKDYDACAGNATVTYMLRALSFVGAGTARFPVSAHDGLAGPEGKWLFPVDGDCT
eukprot:gene4766-21811_t